MSKKFRLAQPIQCAKCPWKKNTDPHQIPHGYSVERHQGLAGTIAEPGAINLGQPLRVMSCHDSPNEAPQHCIGWLDNQLNEGNNIGLRMLMMNCENASAIRTVGPQHQHFNDTLPK